MAFSSFREQQQLSTVDSWQADAHPILIVPLQQRHLSADTNATCMWTELHHMAQRPVLRPS